jgi:restriction endonuclease Mrr
MAVATQAFVLRIAPSGVDGVQEAIETNDLIIGWSCAEDLLDPTLTWEQFRERIRLGCYPDERDNRRPGAAAGNMWRFIRDMRQEDFVLIPHGPEFYVATVAGPARFEPQYADKDMVYRRRMALLNQGRPIPRVYARAALQSRLKVYQTCATATDLIEEIRDVLDWAARGQAPSFAEDLRRNLVQQTLHQIRAGRLNDRSFEELVASILRSLGGDNVRIVPRGLDKGADVLADFTVAKSFKSVLAAQAKHFQQDPPVNTDHLEELIRGMAAEQATLGWFITSGSFSPEVIRRAEQAQEELGLRIELVDGEQLAALVVEGGLRNIIPA